MSHFIITLYFRAVMFGFIQCPQDIYYLDLGYPSSIGYGFHVMEQELSKTNYYSVLPTSFVPPLVKPAYLADRTDCISRDLVLCLCLHFSFSSLWSVFPHQSDQNIGVKASCRHQLNFSLLNELCDIVFGNGALLLVCREQSLPQHQPTLFGNFHVPLDQQLNLMEPSPGTESLIW